MFRLPVIEAIHVTNEIASLAPANYATLARCQKTINWNGPEVQCEKEGCTNGKHYGLWGQPPNRMAVVWFDAKEEEQQEYRDALDRKAQAMSDREFVECSEAFERIANSKEFADYKARIATRRSKISTKENNETIGK